MIKKLDKWCDIDWIIFLCVTVIMPFHVLEEWKFPGGLHYFYNILLHL
ncbi:MAG: hypothetical protein LUH21_13970 [Clostridiales bacterium]|nr:hypothetical protein [Clostridiales bacterium]